MILILFRVDELIPFDDLPISALPTTLFPPPIEVDGGTSDRVDDSLASLPSSYEVSVLGGTFDHLHSGHKILVSIAAWISTRKVIIGVTDAALLVRKSNAHVLESLETRIENVRRFGQTFNPKLEYDVVPISDVYGPTAWDPNIQALVLSHETREGAAAIAKHRKEKSLPPLEPFVINVISPTSSNLDHDDLTTLKDVKMSSTAIRQWIVDHESDRL
ncbi:uncharacterized protein EI90DRAFT_3114871 [Cantharellus anzutake]|uniref:uncharacterized protein n=1 Tax=Cantharellus anzutake TaxID=1750568 RepID=UPI001903F6E2|nr:uncharacterized protein EI90DRAFT_3114871 [Cantharellus anzutake]KAF8344153.1 hypothetical protein EI90DRAFT_3114871 [Cantharellus anzutake]